MNTVRWALLACAGVQLLLPLAARGQGEAALDNHVAQWEAGRYEVVARALIPLRQSVSPRDRLAVDLMIASSLCRTQYATWRRQGLDWLTHVSRVYAVARTDPSLRAELQAEERACRQSPVAITPTRARRLRLAAYGHGASLTVSGGKMWSLACGYRPQWGGATATPPEGAGLATAARRERPSVDLPRLPVPVNERQSADALAPMRGRYGSANEPVTIASDHFVLWSVSGHTETAARALMATLEAYLSDATRTLALKPLDAGMYVFLASDPGTLGEVAARALGVRAAGHFPFAIGASNDAVPALAAVMQARTTMPGTIAHEMLHVLVHRDFPDAPLWLDEGLASLMETAELVDDRVKPLPNWRGRVLTQARRRGSRLSLDALLAPGAMETTVTLVEHSDENTIRGRDELFALDRYFMLFLAERGALSQVYTELRARSPILIAEDRVDVAYASSAEILAIVGRALGASGSSVQSEFDTWLVDALRRTPTELRC